MTLLFVALGVCAVAVDLVVAADAKGGAADEVTFFVVADTHFNDSWFVPEFSKSNRVVIEALNGLPGRSLPPEVGGVVGAPRGVLVLGDLTDGGKPVQWRGRWFRVGGFDPHYPRDGAPGDADRVHWPVYALPGNHDYGGGQTFVAGALASRYGAPRYTLDWGPFHLVLLGRYADAATRDWLAQDLARVEVGHPILLFQHYSFPGSSFGGDDDRWWTAQERNQLKALIDGRGVVAIFHGHAHSPENYQWSGLRLLNPGSAEHNRTIVVVRATAARLDIAWYQVEADAAGRWTGGIWLMSQSLDITAP